MSCFTGVSVKGTYQDKTTDFLLSLDVTSATDFPVINSITVLFGIDSGKHSCKNENGPEISHLRELLMQEDEGKNRCKDRFQGEQESGILRCCILLHNSLYNESVS